MNAGDVGTPVRDEHVHVRWLARGVDDDRLVSLLIESLSLERPTHHLVGPAAETVAQRARRRGDEPGVGRLQEHHELVRFVGGLHGDGADCLDGAHDEIAGVVRGPASEGPIRRQVRVRANDGVAAERAIEAEQRGREDLLRLVAFVPRVAVDSGEATRPVIAAGPAPAVEHRAIVPAPHVHPGERQASVLWLQELRVWIAHDRRERIARAVRKIELQRARGRSEEDVAVLMPAPPLVRRQPERLTA